LKDAPHDVDARTALARAIVFRGNTHLRLGHNDAARRDGALATEALSPNARRTRNPKILALLVSARALAKDLKTTKIQIEALHLIGYRHPEIIDKMTQQ
jgi:hypothetical protein